MALPNIFGTTPQNTQRPGADLDTNFNAIGATGVVPCTASGTNAISLSPFANNITIAAYANYQLFSFQAVANSTGAVTLQVGGLPLLPLYAAGGALQAGNGSILLGQYYLCAFQLALNSGAGGFVLVGATARQPTRTVLVSGSGTYTTPAGATRLNVTLIGGGGGGAGAGTTTTAGSGGPGADTTFGTLTAAHGSAGSGAGNSTGGAGGSATGGDINITGGVGGTSCGSGTAAAGATGAPSPFAGGGAAGTPVGSAGGGAPTNSGAGGGGAGNTGGGVIGGGGGGAGGYLWKLISPAAASYSYTVGAGGTAGAAGTGGNGGGTGGSGLIIVDEYYN